MDYDYIKEIIEEMDTRLENIRIFYPFFQIYKNTKNIEDYDINNLCLSLLAFLLYEGKLKYKDITLKDIIDFLIFFIKAVYGDIVEEGKARNYAEIILDKLQDYGSNFVFQYYSYKTSEHKEKIIKLIEMKLGDNNIFYYSITKEGIDFFLKTKEFPEETQITINLLLFKKQIQSGAFDYALETVKRLNIEVQRKLEKKNYLYDLMRYGGKDGFIAYKEYHHCAMLQFREETELFCDVKSMLQNIYHDLSDMETHIITDIEKKTYINLKLIEKEMNKTIESHSQLLKESAGLTGEYEDILELRRKSAFSEKFNFQREFEHIVTTIDKPEALKFIIEPLFKPNIRKIFNPLNVFYPQKLISAVKKEHYEEDDEVNEIDRETSDDKIQKRVNLNFRFYASHMFDMFQHRKMFTLKDWTVKLKEEYGDNVICNGDFIAYIIQINQRKPSDTGLRDFNLLETGKEGDLSFMEALFRELRKKTNLINIQVETIPEEEIDIGYGIRITDIIFRGTVR